MIECSSDNIYYKKSCKKGHKHKNKKRFLRIAIFLFVCAFLFCYIIQVNKKFELIVESYVNSYCIESINSAINISLKPEVNYGDFITIEKDANGNVSLMTSNSKKINAVSRSVTETTKVLLQQKLMQGINVPWATLTFLPFLEGYGKSINVKILSISSVDCAFYGEFKSVGINQTLHSIYLLVDCEVKVHNSLLKIRVIKNNSSILICETVIVGKVPDIYLTKPII